MLTTTNVGNATQGAQCSGGIVFQGQPADHYSLADRSAQRHTRQDPCVGTPQKDGRGSRSYDGRGLQPKPTNRSQVQISGPSPACPSPSAWHPGLRFRDSNYPPTLRLKDFSTHSDAITGTSEHRSTAPSIRPRPSSASHTPPPAASTTCLCRLLQCPHPPIAPLPVVVVAGVLIQHHPSHISGVPPSWAPKPLLSAPIPVPSGLRTRAQWWGEADRIRATGAAGAQGHAAVACHHCLNPLSVAGDACVNPRRVQLRTAVPQRHDSHQRVPQKPAVQHGDGTPTVPVARVLHGHGGAAGGDHGVPIVRCGDVRRAVAAETLVVGRELGRDRGRAEDRQVRLLQVLRQSSAVVHLGIGVAFSGAPAGDPDGGPVSGVCGGQRQGLDGAG